MMCRIWILNSKISSPRRFATTTPEMTELYGPRAAQSTPPTPARGGDDGIEVLSPRGDPPEMELDVVDGNEADIPMEDMMKLWDQTTREEAREVE